MRVRDIRLFEIVLKDVEHFRVGPTSVVTSKAAICGRVKTGHVN
jgi:hypothetical protein